MFLWGSVPEDVDEETKALLIPRLITSGGLPDYLIAGSDIVDIKPKLYALGAQPWPWDVPAGTEIMIDPACLSGYGATKLPLKFITDGDVWLPVYEQVLYQSFGSFAAPVVTMAAMSPAVHTLFSLPGGNPKIPCKLMYQGMGIRVRGMFFKPDADANASPFRVNLGYSNSTGDEPICMPNTSAAATSEVPFDVVARITKLGPHGTAVYTTPALAKLFTSATHSANGSGDKSSSPDTTLDNYVSFSTTPPNTTATLSILNFTISILP